MEFGFGMFRAPRRPLERIIKMGEGGWLMESDLALAWRSEGRSMGADCHSNPSTLEKRVLLWRKRSPSSHRAIDHKGRWYRKNSLLLLSLHVVS